MESYAKWNLFPGIGEEVFVMTGGGGGFSAVVEKISDRNVLVRRNVPEEYKKFFPNCTTLETHSIKKIKVMETNKERLEEIWKLKHSTTAVKK